MHSRLDVVTMGRKGEYATAVLGIGHFGILCCFVLPLHQFLLYASEAS